MHFLQNVIQPHAVLMLFVAIVCLLGYSVPGYQARASGGFLWLLWLVCGIVAAVAWVLLVMT